MALNQPELSQEEVDDIILDRINNLVSRLKKMGYKVEVDNVEYEFFGRCESLGIKSNIMYPGENLPSLFGVTRGYSGGGIHEALQSTETHRMTSRRQSKANKALGLFYDCFNNILSDIDVMSGAEEVWEGVSL